ncbi:CPBP family intramembrane glutamic endopeptidase [Microbispora sp. NBRC 16548]|uniref:CPBP family intramembrane glutamic endopeptidase n=1 Tax=Microbispora sp. NBRC 16548 TaxID=3030994 RepID=UPI0024A1AA43|nr:CPBP family intramembrane glutamic endopeptidase [Microbispora sp. NBRC 16548]GLX06031.1 abortive infection protein [Microbispora sp. NBRC 16548]
MIRRNADVWLFLLVAFGASWLIALPLWTRAVPLGPPGFQLLGILIMTTPSLGVLAVWLTRRRGTPLKEWARATGLTLGPDRGRTAALLVTALLGVPLLVAVALLASAAVGVVSLDVAGLSLYRAQLSAALGKVPLDPRVMYAVQAVQAVLIAPFINAIPALGEEWGWRGWLLPRLLGDPAVSSGPGARRVWPALVLSGVIWGLWHAPLTLKGYNYPQLGAWAAALFIGFCVIFGALLGWMRLRSRSVWPGVIAHASVNATTGLALLLGDASAPPNPALAGISGIVGWVLLAAVVLVVYRLRPVTAPR